MLLPKGFGSIVRQFVATVGLVWVAYIVGVDQGRTACQAATAQQQLGATVQGAKQARKKTAADLSRAGRAGATRERQRAAIDTHFDTLAQEAADEATKTPAGAAGDGACQLSAAGLRRWAAANAGPWGDPAAAGEARGEPAAATPASAGSAPLGQAGGSGGEPPPGGPRVPPAGEPAVRAADLPAGAD